MPLCELSLNGSDWQIKGYLGADWEERHAVERVLRDGRGWYPASVPGSIQNDLWQAGEVPNPYFERNSLLLEWIPQRTWVYRKSFQVPSEMHSYQLKLVFDGVDYEAYFYLNGLFLGHHVGMYTPVIFDVTDPLDYNNENVLAVVISPAPIEQPQVGRSSQVRTHKARMNYWWDFCPRMVHLGIWDAVKLVSSGRLRIEDVFVQPHLTENLAQAGLEISIELAATKKASAVVDIEIFDPSGNSVLQKYLQCEVIPGLNRLQRELTLESPDLWWPNGMGSQPIYSAQVKAYPEGEAPVSLSDRVEIHFGIRKLDFCQAQGASADSLPYQILVNNQPIYIQGWNWVPIDVLYGGERPQKLKHLLRLAQQAHVNLLRVWGGGLIEKEAFYNECDRLGILIWQEFIQSSSGVENCPPDDPNFLQALEHEARQIIPRRRNHPSLALWVGGNELMIAPGLPANESHPNLDMLHRVVQELDLGRGWLPTSPSGPVFGFTTENIQADPSRLHDVHGPWEFQGLNEQQSLYNQGASLLHSEFGVEGITNRRTLDAVISPKNRWPVSLDNPVWHHLGAWWVKLPVWQAAFGGCLDSLEKTQQAAQLLQAEGLRYAVEADRRRQPYNVGSLPWQFNEPYPMAACTSAVDYYARPKPAYYSVAHAYEPIHVSARFPRLAWPDQKEFTAQIWASNGKSPVLNNFLLSAQIRDIYGETCAAWHTNADLPPGSSVPLMDLIWILNDLPNQLFWLDLTLSSAEGQLVSVNRYPFSRSMDLAPLFTIPETQVVVNHEVSVDCWSVEVQNKGPVVALFAWVEDARPVVSEGYVTIQQNYLCLFPGESRMINMEWSGVEPERRCVEISGWNFKGATLNAED